MDKFDFVTEYNTLMSKYAKLCDFLKRVEDGSSPIHDDYPVSGLYEQQKQMQKELSELKTRLKALGGGRVSAEETLYSSVERPKLVPDKTTLRKHLIEVGRRIQIDAENGFVPDPHICRDITITAKISPFDSVTTIKYEIEEYADPRMSKVENEEV